MANRTGWIELPEKLDLTIRGDTGAREVTKGQANNIGILVADQVEGQSGECAGRTRRRLCRRCDCR
jgi:hypothetical protein